VSLLLLKEELNKNKEIVRFFDIKRIFRKCLPSKNGSRWDGAIPYQLLSYVESGARPLSC